MNKEIENAETLLREWSTDAKLLFLAIRGSHSYGLNVETSDIDLVGIYIASIDELLLGNRRDNSDPGYIGQIQDEKGDIVLYEIERYIELAGKANPSVLECLFTEQDCVLFEDPIFDMVRQHKYSFLTKACKNSIGGYAVQQIDRATRLNKNVLAKRNKVERKTPFEFCYVAANNHSVPLEQYLASNNMIQERCGLTKINHARDLYALYYDPSDLIKMRGICVETSNDIRTTNIPLEYEKSLFVAHVSYNKDGYMEHCKAYRSYMDWVENHNAARYTEQQAHGQTIDSKNMMHCARLIKMAMELPQDKTLNVRRTTDRDYLLSIRRGEVDLFGLLDECQKNIKLMDEMFAQSDLPDTFPVAKIGEIVLTIRKAFYRI
jgi:predicted nucleotidyltransferase